MKDKKKVKYGECLEHDKSYSPMVLASNPPQTRWICRKCGTQGVSVGERIENDYAEYMEKFNTLKD